NTGLGIDLVTGGNNDLAKPVINTVTSNSAGGTAVPGTTIDVYSGDTAGNARKYEGTTTAPAGTWTFTGAGNFTYQYVLATATDGANNTSELADGKTLNAPLFTSPNL